MESFKRNGLYPILSLFVSWNCDCSMREEYQAYLELSSILMLVLISKASAIKPCFVKANAYMPYHAKHAFLFITELEYGNSYEIEYMEKIGSSLSVSFHF